MKNQDTISDGTTRKGSVVFAEDIVKPGWNRTKAHKGTLTLVRAADGHDYLVAYMDVWELGTKDGAIPIPISKDLAPNSSFAIVHAAGCQACGHLHPK